MRSSLWMLVLLFFGAAVPFWWAPYSAAGRIGLAVAQNDHSTLRQHVDWPLLQHAVAAHVREQLVTRQVLDVSLEAEVNWQSNDAALVRLMGRAVGDAANGTRFERAWRLLRRGALEWHSDHEVYLGQGEPRLLMERHGVVWRVVGVKY